MIRMPSPLTHHPDFVRRMAAIHREDRARAALANIYERAGLCFDPADDPLHHVMTDQPTT
jgi:hypothetical protein